MARCAGFALFVIAGWFSLLLNENDAALAMAGGTLKVWHLTDVHVDPYYTVAASADTCYCETTEKCQTCGKDCVVGDPSAPTAARPWGNSEGNCATPQRLFESAAAFMASTSRADVNGGRRTIDQHQQQRHSTHGQTSICLLYTSDAADE